MNAQEELDLIKKEVEKIKREQNEPDKDEIELKILESKNVHKKTGKEFKQYKMNLPKTIIEGILDEKKKVEVKGWHDLKENKLIIEIY